MNLPASFFPLEACEDFQEALRLHFLAWAQDGAARNTAIRSGATLSLLHH